MDTITQKFTDWNEIKIISAATNINYEITVFLSLHVALELKEFPQFLSHVIKL